MFLLCTGGSSGSLEFSSKLLRPKPRDTIAYIHFLYAIAYVQYARWHMLHSMDTIARTTKQLADALRRYRRNKDLTQIRLAERMQVRQATVSKLEAGKPATQLRILMDALTALDLELVVRPRTKISVEDVEDLF